jgi:hypothetical protein
MRTRLPGPGVAGLGARGAQLGEVVEQVPGELLAEGGGRGRGGVTVPLPPAAASASPGSRGGVER